MVQKIKGPLLQFYLHIVLISCNIIECELVKNNTISHDLVTVAHLIHYFKTQTKSQSNQFPFSLFFCFSSFHVIFDASRKEHVHSSNLLGAQNDGKNYVRVSGRKGLPPMLKHFSPKICHVHIIPDKHIF